VICEFGDIVVVPFPFVDLPISRRRPALVLSSGQFNRDHDQSVLAMITTGARSDWPSDIPLVAGGDTGLSQPSKVRFKLFTLPNDLISRRMGKLSEKDRRKVARASRGILAPSPRARS
jgi:mRNA interferase MazF